MNKKNDLAENIIAILSIILLLIIIYEVNKAMIKSEVLRENSRNPILVFPEREDVPIASPIYMHMPCPYQ